MLTSNCLTATSVLMLYTGLPFIHRTAASSDADTHVALFTCISRKEVDMWSLLSIFFSSWSLETVLESYKTTQSVQFTEMRDCGRQNLENPQCVHDFKSHLSHENRGSLDDSSRRSTAISASNSVNKVLMVKKKYTVPWYACVHTDIHR